MDPVFFSPRAPRQRLHRPRPSRAALDWRFPTPLGSFFRREETEAAPHHPSSWSSKRPASQAVWKLRQYPPCGRGRDREPSARTVPGRVPRERDALPRALRGGIQGGVLTGDRGSRSSGRGGRSSPPASRSVALEATRDGWRSCTIPLLCTTLFIGLSA